jgi:uncharacterized membrane protein
MQASEGALSVNNAEAALLNRLKHLIRHSFVLITQVRLAEENLHQLVLHLPIDASVGEYFVNQ